MRYSQLCEVNYGPGILKSVGTIAKNLGITRALVVTDKAINATGHPDRVVEYLKSEGIDSVKYDSVEMDAPDYCVNSGAKIAFDFKADGIIAVGGGSCLDCAKAICIEAANYGSFKIQDMFDAAPGNLKLNPPLKNIMIPTTSGTGSEVTIVAVITDSVGHRKCGCLVKPDSALVDPELTLGLNAEITAYTAMDAFSHSTESLASAGSNPHSDVLALSAIERIVKWAPVAIKEPNNLEARENLAIASNFAGKAFNDAVVNIGHAMAHSLGAWYHIPHGIACALVTPVVLEKTAMTRPEIFSKVAANFGLKVSVNEDFSAKLADSVRDFSRKLGIPSLAKLGITREQAGACSEYTLTEGMRHACIIPVDDSEYKSLLTRVWDTYQ